MNNKYLRPSEKAVYDLRELYKLYGYRHYKVSRFEEYDLYAKNKSFLADKNILTFTDTDGRLMALKPDITLSIIKNTKSDGGTQKMFYNEQVYRTNGGGFCEIMQTGLECIGNIDLYLTYEVISLAYKSLSLINDSFIIDLSHMGFLSGLIDEMTSDETVAKRLLNAVGNKNTAEIKTVCNELCKDADDLCKIAMLYGTPDKCLEQMKDIIKNSKMRDAWEELCDITSLLKQKGLDKNLRLDFSVINDMRYYNGVIFKGFINGISKSVLSGGRYDNLLSGMGKKSGAIGFAVYLDELDRLLMKKRDTDVDVVVLYSKDTSPVAVACKIEEITSTGKTVLAETEAVSDIRYNELIDMRGGDTVEG